jgi:hypothetical protein
LAVAGISDSETYTAALRDGRRCAGPQAGRNAEHDAMATFHPAHR